MDNNKLLTARIFFTHKDGGDVLTVNDRKYLDSMRLQRSKYDKTQFIEVGHIVDLNDVPYKVVGVNINLLNDSINFPDSDVKYNLVINVFVEYTS
jgi:hypothetical protein